MLNIEFTSAQPGIVSLQARVVHFKDEMGGLPPLVQEALQRKPYEPAVEVFLEQDAHIIRHISLRLDSAASTRKQREEAGAALQKMVQSGIEKDLLFDIRGQDKHMLDVLSGLILSLWRFDAYRSSLKPGEKSVLEKVTVLCDQPESMERHFQCIHASIEGISWARSLTSEPPNILYPEAYADRLKELSALGVEVEILDEKALQIIGMTALLAVGQGSARASAVAILRWKGSSGNQPPVAIVGKGVCFDSGGLCLKPAKAQMEMKWDKAGAGVVAGVIKALAIAKAEAHVVGVVGLVENMPDGAAVKPGDVIRTMSGQTVEIADTDAEGRLVLADCVWYVQQRFRPRAIIDLGTLTIETFASLGSDYAGLYSNDAALAVQLKEAGQRSGDLLWELPMGSYFAKQIESAVADVKNVGIDLRGENGAAAEFIKRFVQNVPWAHIDISGVSWSNEDHPIYGNGVTGFGVRLLEEWLKN